MEKRPYTKRIKANNSLSSKRMAIISFGLIVMCSLLVGRMVHLNILPPGTEHCSEIPSTRQCRPNSAPKYEKSVKLSPYRGVIYSRNGHILAMSIRLPTLFVNPKKFDPTADELKKLSKLLGYSPKRIAKLRRKKGYFAYLKRKIKPKISDQVMALKIRGLYQTSEPSRKYPNGSLASHLVGFVGSDDVGLTGLEKTYDKDLRGERITITPSVDGRGEVIFLDSQNARPEQTGNNIYLTIDKVIQEITEKALKEGVEYAEAKHGFAIVTDPYTGKILAAANYPSFEPNSKNNLDFSHTRMRAFLDIFEPGSVTKPFVVATALKEKKILPNQIFDTGDGKLKIGRRTIHDNKPRGLVTPDQILVHSSNIGAYHIAQTLEKPGLYRTLQSFGFGAGAQNLLRFPGIMKGRITPPKKWSEIRFANISFGQGFYATGYEVAAAYGALANGGKLMQLQTINKVESSEGANLMSASSKTISEVLDPSTAAYIREALHKVTIDGGGYKTQSKLYKFGGKTGTTQKYDVELKRYSPNKRIASFAGIAPISDPHVVIYVVVDEPGKRPYYGSLWAAPIFKKIAEETLSYLNVKPSYPKFDLAKKL